MPMRDADQAVSIGRPAATSEPKVISSTTIATTTPMPSAWPGVVGDDAAAELDLQAGLARRVGRRRRARRGRVLELVGRHG